MKRSLITSTGIVSFSGGITEKGSVTAPKPVISQAAEIVHLLRVSSKLSSFLKSL